MKARLKVKQDELPRLAGNLHYLKGMVEIERIIDGEKSYMHISRTMERVIEECSDIVDRLVFAGIEEKE